jgi:tetratricopeptide (TPR) repeat protein
MPRHLAYCAALLGVFVIDNPQCGAYRATHTQLAQVYLRDGLYDQALAETHRALREEDGDTQLLLIATLAYMGQDQPDPALDFLRQAINLEPDNPELYAILREICLHYDRFDQISESLARLNADHPQSAWPLAMQGWIHGQQDRSNEAAVALRQAIALDDNHLFARGELSRILIAGKHYAEAEAMLNQTLRIQPGAQRLILELGDCQLHQGHLTRADSTFRKALATGTGTKAVVDIARIYYEHQHPDRAIEYYERALARAPDDAMILNNLAWTYALEGLRLDYALELSMQAVKLEAQSPVYLDTYAELLHQLGRHAQAVAIMGQALASEPVDGEHRAYLEGQMEKFRQALATSL